MTIDCLAFGRDEICSAILIVLGGGPLRAVGGRDVLFATESKEDTTWGRFAGDLRAHGGDPGLIGYASMDMSRSYQSGARRHCPKATLVFDKFHVIKLANEAVDKVRRRESRELPWCGEQMKKSR